MLRLRPEEHMLLNIRLKKKTGPPEVSPKS